MAKTKEINDLELDYNFPAHDVTIKAKTREEAEENLKNLLKSQKHD